MYAERTGYPVKVIQTEIGNSSVIVWVEGPAHHFSKKFPIFFCFVSIYFVVVIDIIFLDNKNGRKSHKIGSNFNILIK